MTTPQHEESKRRVLVAPPVRGTNMRSLLLAGIAAIMSIAAHALLLLLVLNLDLGPAQAIERDDVSAPLLDTENVMVKPDNPKYAGQNRETEIVLDETVIGNDPSRESGYDVPTIGEFNFPSTATIVDPTQSPGFEDAPPNSQPRDVPPPPGVGALGLGGPIPSSFEGTAPILPNSIGPGGPGGPPTSILFRGRLSPQTRDRLVDQDGGSKESEAMVARGLQFLANHQARDGRWSMNEFDRHARKLVKKGDVSSYVYENDRSNPGTTRKNDTAGTSFGLLPFLAAGYTHYPVSGSKFDYSKSVKAGLDFLVKRQDKDGYYGGGMYAHALATIALCEAYGLTADSSLRVSAQRAIQYIENSQDPAGGGWRYAPRQPGDTSMTGWQLMALKSGQMAGLAVKAETLKKVEQYLDSVEIAKKGGYSYMPGGGETPTMTAVGLLCRQYLGVMPRNPGLLEGVKHLEANPPARLNNIYYLYYATQVMHHMGGDNWEKWNKGPKGDGVGGIRDTLIAAMDKGTNNPDNEGSWVLPGADGRLMATSLALLTLESYYRHLPLYRRDAGAVKGAK